MSILDSKAYRAMEVFYNLLVLNLLWLAVCLPVVTIYPSTTAMFGVVRKWVRKDEPGLFGSFFTLLRENFKQSLWIGLVWTLTGGFLALDLYLTGQMPTALRIPLSLALAFLGFLYLFTSVYLFPVMVNYDLNWTRVLRNSLLLSLSQLTTTLQCLLVVALMGALFVLLPASILVLGSTAAYLIYWLCDRSFRKIPALGHVEKR